MSSTDEPIIRIRNLRKTYRTGKVSVDALRGVNLTVPPGEFLSIVGPSGSGKSTLFHIVGGLTPPSAGEVIVAGQRCLSRGRFGKNRTPPEERQLRFSEIQSAAEPNRQG